MTRAALLAACLTWPSSSRAAVVLAPSPALDALEEEAGKDPAAAGTREASRQDASRGFTGERFQGVTVRSLAPVRTAQAGSADQEEQEPASDEPAPAKKGGRPTYIFKGTSPMKGISIYKAVPDPNGDGSTDKPKSKELISGKIVYGALGAGLLLGILGLVLGAPLLALAGGLLLGAGAALWFVRRKLKGSS